MQNDGHKKKNKKRKGKGNVKGNAVKWTETGRRGSRVTSRHQARERSFRRFGQYDLREGGLLSGVRWEEGDQQRGRGWGGATRYKTIFLSSEYLRILRANFWPPPAGSNVSAEGRAKTASGKRR